MFSWNNIVVFLKLYGLDMNVKRLLHNNSIKYNIP